MRNNLVLVLLLVSIVLLGAGSNTAFESQGTNPNELFTKHCATCHGRDGRARSLKSRLRRAQDLTDPEWQTKVSDERIFNSIANGRKGRGRMPAWSDRLSEEELNALVNHVRSLRK